MPRVVDLMREMGLPFTACAFNNPPDDTYAVYNEEITRRGADLVNCITEHEVTIEVYAYDFADERAVLRVAAVLDRHALPYKKYETTYINSEHLFQTRFELSFTSKDGPPPLDWELEDTYDF